MLEKTTRDAPLVPAMQAASNSLRSWFEEAVDTIVEGRPERGTAQRRVRSAVGHGLAFETWRSLVRRERLSEAEAVELILGLVAAAADGHRR